ncbi:hypothetical protein [Cupriavidus necator]
MPMMPVYVSRWVLLKNCSRRFGFEVKRVTLEVRCEGVRNIDLVAGDGVAGSGAVLLRCGAFPAVLIGSTAIESLPGYQGDEGRSAKQEPSEIL